MQPVVQPAVQRVVSCIRGFNKNLREALQSQPSNPVYTLATQNVVITALHVMQTRYSDESSVRPSVRPSVRLSHAWIVTKRKKDLSRFLYHTKYNLA